MIQEAVVNEIINILKGRTKPINSQMICDDINKKIKLDPKMTPQRLRTHINYIRANGSMCILSSSSGYWEGNPNTDKEEIIKVYYSLIARAKKIEQAADGIWYHWVSKTSPAPLKIK
jgi:hypothetical protein